MKLTLAEPKYLKDSVAIISDLVTEGKFTVTKEGLELVAMENRPEDYAMTLAAWADGLKANKAAAIDSVGEDRFKFYMGSCKGGALLYRRRRFYLCRFEFRRRGR